ncbi:DUF444 family protein [Geobacter hydrogenophilus]|uniref:DUF444 family protein n=1 Tax=Geobacter hydrogenophilus TaxID=40983 RepID=A0A9W6G082_9BACT|nr:DUF444 family protein [Geobacter hydrogenophilus]MBT0894003.1 DUF444 family protein [Geobacter hydrogenophilus]GLI38050.1 hypothetical protein GHYDROH2_15510 [Geobacter hydrogenophilus]
MKTDDSKPIELWNISSLAPEPEGSYTTRIRSLDELLERDRLREEDGFPRKIRIGKLIKPGKGKQEKFVVVPTTVEEKFMHDRAPTPPEEEEPMGGTGDEAEGDILGEQPVRPEQGAGSGTAGHGGGEGHELESSAYDLGRILTERFNLPNLKEKGKKSSFSHYTYDLTDRNRGFGQILEKKQTLRRVIETNIALGNIDDVTNIDTTRLLIDPRDRIFRILSRELEYESQALVFFVRDYSGSMEGKASEVICSQHVLIYSWLLYQFARQVETRFVLHDNDAREVPDFYTYYNLRVAGGTRVAAAYKMVNDIVEQESLAKDYNIYVFHGTDGDDWDTNGEETIPELRRMLTYTNRVGITIAEHNAYGSRGATEVERYLKGSGLLDEKPEFLRMDVMGEDADETRIIDGIKRLIS